MKLEQTATKRLLITNLEIDDHDFYNSLYTDTENYQYATGVLSNKPIAFLDMLHKISFDDEFFYIVKKKGCLKKIGCVKGQLYTPNKAIWLSMLVIIKCEQRKGYGNELFKSLCCYWKSYYSINKIIISVDSRNKGGLIFWYNMGFKDLKPIGLIENAKKSDSSRIILLHREL